MKEWWMAFWKKHGERWLHLGGAILMSVGFILSDIEELKSAGYATLIMILGILVNKARSPEKREQEQA